MGTIIKVYEISDLKKDGSFKKKNNVKFYDEKNFFIYLTTNNLKISHGYFDITGNISNGKKFKCSYGGLIIGTSAIVKEFNKLICQ